MTCKYVVAQGCPTENDCEDCGLGPCFGNRAGDEVFGTDLSDDELLLVCDARHTALREVFAGDHITDYNCANRIETACKALTLAIDAYVARLRRK